MKTVEFDPFKARVYVANGDGTITGYDEAGNEVTFYCEAPDVCPRPKEN